MKNPKNVEAVLDWYRRHQPDSVGTVERLFEIDAANPNDRTTAPMVALVLQGFEAGREFERAHPEVESGAGYLNG